MPRGKKGPRPEMKVTEERGITIIEEDFLGGPHSELKIDKEWLCADCPFKTAELNYLEQHWKSAGHGVYGIPAKEPEAATANAEPVAEQPELFKEPGIVIRYVNVSPAPEVLAEHRKALADLAQEYLAIKDAKKAADAGFNTQISEIDTKMREIVLALKYPGQYLVECEWRVIDGENARGLYRLDTGECIETAALTAEDRAAELDEVTAANEFC